MPPTEYAELTEPSAGDGLPQISQICTELLAAYILPQNSQISQNLLISGGALVSRAPTKQTVVLPQISQIYTEAANFRLVHFLLGWCTSYSVGALETSAPP